MLHHTSFLWDYDDEMMKALKVSFLATIDT